MFKDHFSRQAADYARYRPGYPDELFEFLADQAPARERALDVATGNGQAAIGLARHFREVRATDLSRTQLECATAHPRVTYVLEPAEQVAVPDAHFDLLAAAQAAHWFDFPRFNAEARRVVRPGGLIALWSYEKFRVDADVDRVIDDFYRDVVGPCWPPERHFVEEGYRTLPFPFEEIEAPVFGLRLSWDLDTAIRYLGTWSAVQRYRALNARDPLVLLRPLLAPAWGAGERSLAFPVHLRLGRN
jgi:SAM-dependent methyltransferase